MAGLFLALKLYFTLKADPFADEAYYWMWGQHPGLSYFDHPPLHAWLLWVVDALFGWHRTSVRILTWATLAGILAIFWDWSGRLAPLDRTGWFWRATTIYLASPFYFAMTSIAYNDHLLVFLGLLAIHCFAVFTFRHEAGERGGLPWLYLAATALGLATLTKYNGIVVGLGFAAAFLVRPSLRSLLATPHPWLAGLLALGMQAPVIYWNLTVGLASYRFHMVDRWGGDAPWHISFGAPAAFLVLNLLLLSPFLIWPLVTLVRSRPETSFEDAARTVALSTMTVSSLLFLGLTAVIGGYFYWNILAFIGVIPLLVRFVGRRIVLWTHLVFGLLAASLLVLNFTVTPITVFDSNRASAINFAWAEVARHIRAAQASYPDDTLAATRYSTTSQLGFVLGSTDVVPIAREPLLQYQFWFDPRSLAGKSALILTDEGDKSPVIAYLRDRFDTLALVDEFEISSWGRVIYRWRIFRGEGYKPR